MYTRKFPTEAIEIVLLEDYLLQAFLSVPKKPDSENRLFFAVRSPSGLLGEETKE
jgi:hypothetical protein